MEEDVRFYSIQKSKKACCIADILIKLNNEKASKKYTIISSKLRLNTLVTDS